MGRGGEYGHGEEEREPQEQEEADPVEDHRGEAPLVLGLAGLVLKGGFLKCAKTRFLPANIFYLLFDLVRDDLDLT